MPAISWQDLTLNTLLQNRTLSLLQLNFSSDLKTNVLEDFSVIFNLRESDIPLVVDFV